MAGSCCDDSQPYNRDVGFSDEIQFIVMEYIDGITLKEFIEQQGVLRWKDALHFVTQILRAL